MSKNMKNKKEEESPIEKKYYKKEKVGWEELSNKENEEIEKLSKNYRKFLDSYKIEREIVKGVEELAKKNGYVSIQQANKNTKKIYAINRDKNIVLIQHGKKPMEKGLRIIGTHIDVLKLDFKPNPVFQDGEYCMINLHYYGGIKNFHWMNVPLAIHGVIFDEKGKKTEIVIGENEEDPVFVITDLLPHLGKDVDEKTAKDIIRGEQLDALAATIPIEDKKAKEKVKAKFFEAINKKYSITEEDFISAELCLVPAIKSREIGIDKSMIGAPAHDDRSCSYLAVEAVMQTKNPEYTSIAFLTDKEEIGSVGNTAMSSYFFENLITELIKKKNENTTAREVLAKSRILSGDVTAATDPKFRDKFDGHNANKIGYGVAIEKYTGSGGKYYGNDANAEYISWIRQMLNENKIIWQTGELGKVDEGGGGTIAHILAKTGAEVVDVGPPVLAMHSPFEIVSKVDLYNTLKTYKAFFVWEK